MIDGFFEYISYNNEKKLQYCNFIKLLNFKEKKIFLIFYKIKKCI